MENKTRLFAALAIAVVIIPLAARALDDSSTNDEAAPLMYNKGAQVRLLQLEKSIGTNIIVGQETLNFLGSANTSFDTAALETILESLKSVNVSVAALNYTGNKTELVRQFVDLKSDAINLTKQFRYALNGSGLNETQRMAIRDAARPKVAAYIKSINEQVRDLVRQYNAERVDDFLKKMSEARPAIVEGIRNGSISMEKVRENMQRVFDNMTDARRRVAAQAVEKERSDFMSNISAQLRIAQDRMMERQQERLNNLSQTFRPRNAANATRTMRGGSR